MAGSTASAPRTSPPGPRGLPGLGMLLPIRRNPLAVFQRTAREFGDVAFLQILSRRGYLITNPRDVRHVLQDNARNYRKSPLYQKLRTSIGDGLLTSEGEFWLHQRRIAQPAFSRQRIAALAGVMADAARETAAQWDALAAAGAPVDIADEMMRLTRTVVVRALLGGTVVDIDAAWRTMNEHIADSFWSLGLAEHLPTSKNRRFHEARAFVRDAVDRIIRERRRAPAEHTDLLAMLMAARDEDTGEGMTDEQLRVEVTTFLLAGQETTSLALTWTWYLLSQHPEAAKRLNDEVDGLSALPDRSHLMTLPYTRMVIDEALRLYPPAWGFSRQALGDDELGGFHLPPGWLAFVIPYVLHRLPAYWEDPERFDPERFSAERSASRPKFLYLPFGGGPRQCIGNHFALLEAQVIVATLARRFQLRLVPGHPVEAEPLITLRPKHGMMMTIERRSVAAGV